MRKMLGGLVLLNLCAISLNFTAGEESITNEEVLSQLRDLRSFIDEKRDFTKGAKGLKPVAVQYRSSDADVDGIVFCNLSFNTDALHLSIAGYSVQADGTPLSIIINVVYEWTEYVGYTIKSAKINATKSFALEDIAIDGDVKITGDVDVTGDISGDSIIENMTGYSFETNSSGETLTYDYIYAGVVKNGNKVTFVINVDITRLDATAGSNVPLGAFTIPSEIASKLIPDSNNWLGFYNVYCGSDYNAGINLPALIIKSQNVLTFRLYKSGDLTLNTKYNVRFETTFLLSDNLLPSGE